MPARMDLVDRIVAFCRALREEGVRVSTTHAIAALQAVSAINIADREQFYHALQAVLTSSPVEQAVFAAVFARFWGLPVGEGCSAEAEPAARPALAAPAPVAPPAEPDGDPVPLASARPRRSQGPEPEAGPPSPDGRLEPARDAYRFPRPAEEPAREAPPAASGGQRGGASYEEVAAVRAFRPATPAELARLRRAAARLLGSARYLPAGRARPRRDRGQPDVRRSVRRSLRYGGELVELRRRGKAPARVDLVALLDVSGSMDAYTEFMLQFLYALQSSARNVETFVFSTRLSRITPWLRRGFAMALGEVARRVRHWSGGTRLGECLKEFNDRWGAGCSGASTCALIISDGWDRGDPEVLARELARLKQRTRLLLWLNPLLGVPGYQPLARGLQIASRYVDLFLPCRDTDALLKAVAHLAGGRLREGVRAGPQGAA